MRWGTFLTICALILMILGAAAAQMLFHLAG